MHTDFESFRQAVLRDPALQAQLRTVAEHDQWITLVARLGAERGYTFTRDDVLEAWRASRRAWHERWVRNEYA